MSLDVRVSHLSILARSADPLIFDQSMSAPAYDTHSGQRQTARDYLVKGDLHEESLLLYRI